MAEKYFFISFSIIFVIGFLQGAILGRGIRAKFPKLKIHAKAVSLILLVLFSINAVSSTINFADPTKISLSEIQIPTTPDAGYKFLLTVLGLNAGIGTVFVVFVSVSLILFFKFAKIHRIGRYFIFSISVIMVIISTLAKFTDFIPNSFQIAMYVFYQLGLTLGIFLITRRKMVVSEFDSY